MMSNMKAAGIFADKPTLVGSRVVLRPFTEADIEAMGPVLADPEVLRLSGSVHSTEEANGASPELDQRTLTWYRTRAEQDDRLDLALVDAATDLCVGEAVLNEWRPESRVCNFRILIGAKGRDRGLGSEAIRLMVDHAFRSTDLNRIELEVYAFNPRALRVYRQAGFVEEGRRREALRFDGAYVDAIVMSLLRMEWQERQGGS